MGGNYNRHQWNHKIISEYFENLYSRKLENQKEIDKFLDIYDSPKLNQEDINSLNRSKMSNEIETVIKNLKTKNDQSQIDSLLNSTRPLKKN
jgi:hypothetical protein